MTVFIRDRDRCRLCFTLIQREHSILPPSTCCQRSSNLFEKIQRKSTPNTQLSLFQHNKSKQRKVSYHDLVRRYLRTDISLSKTPSSNAICSQCSVALLDIEQCARYLRKNIQQLKGKLNKSNQLFTSSLSVKFQKKFISKEKLSTENQQILKTNDAAGEENDDDDDDDDDDNDDDEEEFNEIDDEEDSSDGVEGNDQPSALRLASLYSSGGAISILDKVKKSQNTTNYQCNGNEDDDGDIDDDEDDEEENESLLTNVKQPQRTDQRSVSNIDNNLVDSNGNLSDENNPQLAQLRLFQMMANLATVSPLANNISNHVNHSNPTMAALATMHRNFLMKFVNDPMTQQTLSPNKTNHAANSSEEKPALSGGRKRKSTPGKRLPRTDGMNSAHLSTSNDDENQSKPLSDDYPLALTVKNGQQINDNRDQKNNVKNNRNNGTNEQFCHSTMTIDQELAINSTPNDLSMTLSPPSTNRRPTPSKRQRTPTSSSHIDAIANFNQQSTSNSTNLDDSTSSAMQRQQRKLDPRHCTTCNKVLFSDKTHLIHCQTHAKSEKNCWICGAYDEDIKKHIINEHGNQKFTAAGFKCQHCEKSFQIFSDLDAHTKEHTKKKPFECHICHKRFGQQGNLSCHLRIHSGVKPFNCSSCGKAFRHSNSLRRHARTVHSVTRSLNSSSNSLLPDTNLSFNHDDKQENFDDVPSALMIPSDDGSSSTGGMPSPSMSNLPMDNDSSEPSGMH